MPKRPLSLLLLCLLLSTQGCGAILFRTQQKVPMQCINVPTAQFTVEGQGMARSGEVLPLDRREDHVVEVTADGYATQTVRLVSEVSIWRGAISVVLNGGHGFFTFFVSTVLGIPVDIAAGAWEVLEPTRVRVELVPDGSAPVATGPTQPPPPRPTQPTSSTTTFCPSCGTRAGTTTFCTSCGARLR